MRSIAIALSSLLLPLLQAAVVETDWCRIEAPDSVKVQENFSVKVFLKQGAPAGLKLGGDIHLLKQDGTYLGFGAWGGTPRDAAPGSVTEFQYRMPPMKNGADTAIVHYFLTKNGWAERAKDVPSPRIKVEGANTKRPASASLKKSWITTGRAERADGRPLSSHPLREGEEFLLPVRYYVDPSDDWGGTELTILGVGPWIDCPDGVYSKHQRHMMYPLTIAPLRCRIGEEVREKIRIRVPKLFSARPPEAGVLGDSLLLIFQFRGNDGEKWPWQVRTELGNFQRGESFFDLSTPMPGNLFPGSKAVEIVVTPGTLAKKSGETRELVWQIFQIDGSLIASGRQTISAAAEPLRIFPQIPPEKRGTFRFRASVAGWETRETTFARIPDVEALTKGAATPFGGQKFAGNPEAVAAARLLGLRFCRTWVKWSSLQPAPEVWNDAFLRELKESVAQLNANGIRPWLVLYDPPAWAIDNPEGWTAGFFPFPFQEKQLETVVRRLAEAFKGQVTGFEWLNEICPGKLSANPVEDYLRFCRVATQTAKAVDPSFEIQAAGGLWPRSYRKSLLAAGLAHHVDLLPIHYGDANSVQLATEDLKNHGATLPVIDNETGRGLSTWGMPLEFALKDRSQSDYFFTRFPAELLAGCRKIVLFGGEPDPAGNWTIFWGDMSPRPSAAALAVLISRLWNARPVGEFTLGRGDSIKLFEGPGKRAVMVVSTVEKKGETIQLPAGKGELILTDQQGNERRLPEAERHTLELTTSPYLVEGGEIDVLKAQLMVRPTAAGSGASNRNFVQGHAAELPVTITNLIDRPLNCRIELTGIPGRSAPIVVSDLAPGETLQKSFPFLPERSGKFTAILRVNFQTPGFPEVKKRVSISVIQPEAVGNLLKNPGFEQARGGEETLPAFWYPTPGDAGKRFRFQSPDELGHGEWVFRFQGVEKQYVSMFQNLEGPFLPGKYLYSFWIKSDSLQTGSNYSAIAPDGRSIQRHWLQIFQSPVTQPHWELFSAVVEVPEKTEKISCVPVCFGSGWSMIDNAIFTLYEGTEYVGFAPRSRSITIDGELNDFDRSSPVPLLGKSQLRAERAGYEWSPQRFSGVAYFNWDEQNLYVGVEVIDREHTPGPREAECVKGDSVEIAIHPQNRLPGEESKALLFQVSSVAPGGSGRHTIYRPDRFCGGLKSGSLAKDSSVYDISVRRLGNRTTYELAMPWSDLGGIRGEFGTKLGLSLALNDGDGTRKLASMIWGGGLIPAWNPASFGMLVLVENRPQLRKGK